MSDEVTAGTALGINNTDEKKEDKKEVKLEIAQKETINLR